MARTCPACTLDNSLTAERCILCGSLLILNSKGEVGRNNENIAKRDKDCFISPLARKPKRRKYSTSETEDFLSRKVRKRRKSAEGRDVSRKRKTSRIEDDAVRRRGKKKKTVDIDLSTESPIKEKNNVKKEKINVISSKWLENLPKIPLSKVKKRSTQSSTIKNLLSKNGKSKTYNPWIEDLANRGKRKYAKTRKLGDDMFVNRFFPTCKDDLCVHIHKVQLMEHWLKQFLSASQAGRSNVLVLSGPAGSGKSTLVKTICKEMKFLVMPYQETSTSLADTFLKRDINQQFLLYESRLSKFQKFLQRTSRYRALQNTDYVGQVVLVEERPWTGKPKFREQFREICNRLISLARNPVIFTISTSHEGSKDEARRLFGEQFLENAAVTQMTLNAVNNTLMRKALDRALQQCGDPAIPKKKLIKQVIEGANGDIRVAFQNLEMILRGDTRKKKTRSKRTRKDKKGKSKAPALPKYRDHNLSIFHALGKILYAKRKRSPEDIVVESPCEPLSFCDWVWENSPRFLVDADLESIIVQSEDVSDGDILAKSSKNKWEQAGEAAVPDQYASSIFTRAYLCAQSAKKVSKRDLQGPAHTKIKRLQTELTNAVGATRILSEVLGINRPKSLFTSYLTSEAISNHIKTKEQHNLLQVLNCKYSSRHESLPLPEVLFAEQPCFGRKVRQRRCSLTGSINKLKIVEQEAIEEFD